MGVRFDCWFNVYGVRFIREPVGVGPNVPRTFISEQRPIHRPCYTHIQPSILISPKHVGGELKAR